MILLSFGVVGAFVVGGKVWRVCMSFSAVLVPALLASLVGFVPTVMESCALAFAKAISWVAVALFVEGGVVKIFLRRSGVS